jgi:hypothetical protein
MWIYSADYYDYFSLVYCSVFLQINTAHGAWTSHRVLVTFLRPSTLLLLISRHQ